jgi:hypothetical protein
VGRKGRRGREGGGGRTREEESANSETFGGWAAAKSEIDCPAITIRCTQPADGFRAEAMCFRVGVISVSAFFRIFQTDRTRLFGWRPNRGSSGFDTRRPSDSPLHRRADHYCRTHNAHHVIARVALQRRRYILPIYENASRRRIPWRNAESRPSRSRSR